MSVFSKVRGFFGRHRNKFIVGGVIISGSILLTRYAQQKLREWQERETLEFLERTRKQQHFDSIGRTCNQTVLNLTKTLNETVASTVNTEEIIDKIKKNPENKVDLWNELKVQVFVRTACSIYATVMLVVTLKIQLSLIGGYLYKDPTSLSSEMQEKYLSLCENLMNTGFSRLYKLMEKICKKVLDPVDLTKQLKLSDFEAVLWSIQTGVATDNDNPIDNIRQYILPQIPKTNGIYEKVIQDTVDLLESDEVKSLATHCTNRGFMLLGEQVASFYSQPKLVEIEATQRDEFTNPYSIKKPMAKLLPIVNGLFTKHSLPNLFLQQLITYEKLQALSANVYECLL